MLDLYPKVKEERRKRTRSSGIRNERPVIQNAGRYMHPVQKVDMEVDISVKALGEESALGLPRREGTSYIAGCDFGESDTLVLSFNSRVRTGKI